MRNEESKNKSRMIIRRSFPAKTYSSNPLPKGYCFFSDVSTPGLPPGLGVIMAPHGSPGAPARWLQAPQCQRIAASAQAPRFFFTKTTKIHAADLGGSEIFRKNSKFGFQTFKGSVSRRTLFWSKFHVMWFFQGAKSHISTVLVVCVFGVFDSWIPKMSGPSRLVERKVHRMCSMNSRPNSGAPLIDIEAEWRAWEAQQQVKGKHFLGACHVFQGLHIMMGFLWNVRFSTFKNGALFFFFASQKNCWDLSEVPFFPA